MKVILEFDDLDEAKHYIRAEQYYCVLFDIKQHLRNKMKYVDLNECQYDVYQHLQNTYASILEDYEINID
jgi:hypothetical protein